MNVTKMRFDECEFLWNGDKTKNVLATIHEKVLEDVKMFLAVLELRC